METKETRLAGLARDFSTAVDAASARINQTQKALIERAAAKARANELALKRRIGLARSGLRRLLAFGASPAMQQIVEAMNRMPDGQAVTQFFALQWTWISERPNTTLRVSFDTEGVRFDTVDICWVRQTKTFRIPYVGQEVLYEEMLGNRVGKGKSSFDGFLEAIATLQRVDFADLSASNSPNVYLEEEVIFQMLISWAHKATFEKAVMRCLEHLELVLKRASLKAA